MLRAPADGIVMTRVIEPGTVVLPTSPVYSMALTNEVWVRAFVPEPMLSRVVPGSIVRVYTDGRGPASPIEGRIGYVSPTRGVHAEDRRDARNFARSSSIGCASGSRPRTTASARACRSRSRSAPGRDHAARAHRGPAPRLRRTAAALDDITAEIRPGVITGLIGPDGAGKTTLLRLIAGLLRPTRGPRRGARPRHGARCRGRASGSIGYMPQRFGLYEDLSVAENLDLFADLHAMAAPRARERAERLLRFTGLAPVHRPPRRASSPAA